MNGLRKLGLALFALAVGAPSGAMAAEPPPVPTQSSSAPTMMTVYEAVLSNGFTLRHDHSEVQGNVIRLYLTPSSRGGYVDVPSTDIVRFERQQVPAPPPPATATTGDVGQIVTAAGDRHQLDPDFISSVIRAESAGNPAAVSPKGAQGLMQLMPQTASRLGVKNSFEPAENVDGGSRYLRELLELYHGDAAKALAAYNAGPHRVEQYRGVPPYRETHAYVARVIRDYNRAKLAQHPELKNSRAKGAGAKPKSAKRQTTASRSAADQSRLSKPPDLPANQQ